MTASDPADFKPLCGDLDFLREVAEGGRALMSAALLGCSPVVRRATRRSRRLCDVGPFSPPCRRSNKTVIRRVPVRGVTQFRRVVIFFTIAKRWATWSPGQCLLALRRKFSDGGLGAAGRPGEARRRRSHRPAPPSRCECPRSRARSCDGSDRRVRVPRHTRSQPACQQ